MLKSIILPAGCALAVMLSGCATGPQLPAKSAPPPAVVAMARLKGSEETSTLFDNFTAFVTWTNGREVAAGRAGWNTPVEIPAGANKLTVEFNRGNFMASTELELTAAAAANYEVRFATDAQVFGRNSYCDFWIVDLGSGQAVTPVKRAAVKKR